MSGSDDTTKIRVNVLGGNDVGDEKKALGGAEKGDGSGLFLFW